MNKLITFPPFYFFLCIFISPASYILFPAYSLIKFPFNLIGILPFAYGFKVLRRASKLFETKKTTFRLETSRELVIEGDFKYSRNPMYLGSLILIIGLSVFIGSSIGLLSPILFFMTINFLVIPREEKLMEQTFESDYIKYKNNVRRWI